MVLGCKIYTSDTSQRKRNNIALTGYYNVAENGSAIYTAPRDAEKRIKYNNSYTKYDTHGNIIRHCICILAGTRLDLNPCYSIIDSTYIIVFQVFKKMEV